MLIAEFLKVIHLLTFQFIPDLFNDALSTAQIRNFGY